MIPRKQPALHRFASYHFVLPGMTIQFVTLGMFIIDDFTFADEQGKPTGKIVPPQGRLGSTSSHCRHSYNAL